MQENNFLSGQIARELDFYRVRDEIALNAVSEETQEYIQQREASCDIETIRSLKKAGREWCTYLNSTRPAAISPWPQVNDLFEQLDVEGAQLLQDQIYALGLFAFSCEKAADSITSASMEFEIPELYKTVKDMPSLKNPHTEIFRILNQDGSVKDLPQIREIKNKISALRKEIENAIRKYTSDSAFSGILQSQVPAFKADRELIAVKASCRNQINGIIHEVSASGQTVYIEPLEAVQAGNALIQEEFNLESQLRLIFKELTAKLSPYKNDFITCFNKMLFLDSTLAAARQLIKTSGVFAEECDMTKEPPRIAAARHPLLKEKAVPVDINFMGQKRVLIITGPNTGGKTVTLKTIALFCLLNQAGFPLPAAEGTRLPYFDSVFADIGDEQSIDQSLSTFSAHMKKMAEMTKYAGEKSLVLLDELGSGTDPQEGSAIAMAVLDNLIEKKAFVIATTHHGVLKNYGYTNPYCINASVEFNQDNLSPTYRLLMGVPGESHAIDIAVNAGLEEEIISKARNYISTQQSDVSTLIKGLTAKHEELDQLLKEENIKNSELMIKSHKLHSRENNLLEREIEIKKKERSQNSDFVKETRSRLENLVRELREGEITREKTLGVKDFISQLNSQIEEQEENIKLQKKNLEEEKLKAEREEEEISSNGIRLSKLKGAHASNKKTSKKTSNKDALKNAQPQTYSSLPENKKKKEEKRIVLAEGMEVLAGKEKRKGTLVRKINSDTWSVQFGFLKMNVKENALVPVNIEKSIVSSKADYVLEKSSSESDEAPKYELRLLGMRYEEAIKALKKQLDLCAIYNFKNFSIIHGKGNGILQQAVHDLLSNYPGVKNFSFALPEAGGTGKTYVELD
ncbi:Smr/MutS family protein [Treponema sp.]|uniref:endonuclease MutS2 n=1 Tax=Treponema sp. TaxID=166 RepID=UPI0025EEF9A7|nr:Smr/MutS family protein [Treponema sp.]MCR5217102.1 Smr/MutS family protein [Treponema sp.]